jgi:phosphonopyruvate decarboxylase
MIQPDVFVAALRARGVEFFVGVPDSLLEEFTKGVTEMLPEVRHVISANEGNAIALACGYHLSTNRTACAYLQNSGLGNAINPLTSLTHGSVHAIPVFMCIGWRGFPGSDDEPQHVQQGAITEAQLSLLGIPFRILGPETTGRELERSLDVLFEHLAARNAPAAILVKKGAFMPRLDEIVTGAGAPDLHREAAIDQILSLSDPDDLVVATTGRTSRELFELRRERGEPNHDFLTLGGMGHASSVALGVALGRPERRVICLDGDGALLMHMGALPIVGSLRPPNLVHVLLNNGAHESVGGFPTVARDIDFRALSSATGYGDYYHTDSRSTLTDAWGRLAEGCGPSFIEVKVAVGSRPGLGRPTQTPGVTKGAFMRHASRSE